MKLIKGVRTDIVIGLLVALIGGSAIAGMTDKADQVGIEKVSSTSPSLRWASHFTWTFTNNTDWTLTNVVVGHSAGSADNNYTFASIAPHQTVGPFYADWYSSSPDYWRLDFDHSDDEGHGNYRWSITMDGNFERYKKCSIYESDIDSGQPVQFFYSKKQNIAARQDYDLAYIVPPKSDPCSGYVVPFYKLTSNLY
jgi:hypothetical protein